MLWTLLATCEFLACAWIYHASLNLAHPGQVQIVNIIICSLVITLVVYCVVGNIWATNNTPIRSSVSNLSSATSTPMEKLLKYTYMWLTNNNADIHILKNEQYPSVQYSRYYENAWWLRAGFFTHLRRIMKQMLMLSMGAQRLTITTEEVPNKRPLAITWTIWS